MVTSLGCRTAYEQRCSLQSLRRRCTERRSFDAHHYVAPHVRHQIAAHERGREGLQGQPSCFHRAVRQHDGALWRDSQELMLAVNLDLDGLDDAVVDVEPSDMGTRHEK